MLNKVMKKISVILMTIILIALVLPVQSVMAEEETYNVYVQVPDEWGTPYIWAWGEPGVGSMSKAWPGELMNDNGNGFYSYTVNDKYFNLVFSDGGSSQSEDIRVVGSDVEIVVNADGTYEIEYLDGFETEWENSITVTATIPNDWEHPYIWAWDDTIGNVYEKWPGAPMTVVDGVCVMELPDWVTGVIISANNASVQTRDIIVDDGKDIWLEVNSTSDVVVKYNGEKVDTEDNTTPEEDTMDNSGNEGSLATGEEQTSGNKDDNKPNNNNVIYIVVTVAVFIIIILVVTFTGNGRNKKHSQRTYSSETDIEDVKIDDADLDVDVDDIDA